MATPTDSNTAAAIRRAVLTGALAALVCAQLPAAAAAQSRRDPTPEERAAIVKVYGVVDSIVTPFLAAHDMVLDASSSAGDEDLSVPGAGVIGTAFSWDSSIKQDSDRYQKRVRPALLRIQGLMQAGKVDDVRAARREMERWTHLRITVELNAGALGLGSAPAKNTPLAIAGVARGFVVAEDAEAPDNRGNRVLAFGDWKGARPDTANAALRFRFAHAAQTPFVENVVITLSGADDLVRELLARTEWARVAGALTR